MAGLGSCRGGAGVLLGDPPQQPLPPGKLASLQWRCGDPHPEGTPPLSRLEGCTPAASTGGHQRRWPGRSVKRRPGGLWVWGWGCSPGLSRSVTIWGRGPHQGPRDEGLLCSQLRAAWLPQEARPRAFSVSLGSLAVKTGEGEQRAAAPLLLRPCSSFWCSDKPSQRKTKRDTHGGAGREKRRRREEEA